MHVGYARYHYGELPEEVARDLTLFFPDEIEQFAELGGRLCVTRDEVDPPKWSIDVVGDDAWHDSLSGAVTRLVVIRQIMGLRDQLPMFSFRDADNPKRICWQNSPFRMQRVIEDFLPFPVEIAPGWDVDTFTQLGRYPFAFVRGVLRVKTEKDAVLAAMLAS